MREQVRSGVSVCNGLDRTTEQSDGEEAPMPGLNLPTIISNPPSKRTSRRQPVDHFIPHFECGVRTSMRLNTHRPCRDPPFGLKAPSTSQLPPTLNRSQRLLHSPFRSPVAQQATAASHYVSPSSVNSGAILTPPSLAVVPQNPGYAPWLYHHQRGQDP